MHATRDTSPSFLSRAKMREFVHKVRNFRQDSELKPPANSPPTNLDPIFATAASTNATFISATTRIMANNPPNKVVGPYFYGNGRRPATANAALRKVLLMHLFIFHYYINTFTLTSHRNHHLTPRPHLRPPLHTLTPPPPPC